MERANVDYQDFGRGTLGLLIEKANCGGLPPRFPGLRPGLSGVAPLEPEGGHSTGRRRI